MADEEKNTDEANADTNSDYATRLAAWQARRAEIVRLHDEEGKAFAEIGELFNMTRSMAHQLYWRAKGKKKKKWVKDAGKD
jgi:DNA-directed RNA polymerase specialized sigma24 family protein